MLESYPKPYAVYETLTHLTQQDGYFDSNFCLTSRSAACGPPPPSAARCPVALSSNLPILLVYNMFGGWILAHHGS